MPFSHPRGYQRNATERMRASVRFRYTHRPIATTLAFFQDPFRIPACAIGFPVVSCTVKIPHPLQNAPMIQFYRRLTSWLFATLCTSTLLAQPKINSFTPASGPKGTTVTINGTNFNTTPDSNYVWFGGVRAAVTAATATQLTVTVPASATYDPISVLNRGTQLIGYSNKAFLETFNGGATDQTVINPNRYPPVNFPIGLPIGPVAADIDGDGKPDLIVNEGGVAAIFRNTSTPGTLDYTSLAANVTFYAGQGASNLVIRDLDGDGKPDLLCSSNQNNFHAYISANTSTPGHISFGAAQAYAFSGGFIDAADMDGDGKLDLVMAFQGGVALWLNTTPKGGALSFANPVTYGISGNTADLSVIDIDGDGKPDVVCANGGDKTISILRNTTPRPGVANDSSFAPYLVIPTNRPANHLIIRDIDADGKPDIVVSTDSGLAILKNVATPGSLSTASFSTEVDIPVCAGITDVAIADLDGDGKPDITTSSVDPSGGFASILKNITVPGTINAASFAQHTDIHAGGWGDGIFVADIDGDGRPELIVSGSFTPGAMSIIKPVINTQPPTLASFTPNSATTGQTVTITGRNLSGATAVSIGGTPVASFVTVSDTVITAVLAGGATGNIGVTTPLGSATIGGFHFIVAPNVAPVITSFNPTTASPGTMVTITGTNLTGVTAVSFGGSPAGSFTVVSPTTITAVVNTGTSGNVTVTAPAGTATLGGFTYNWAATRISSFTPSSGAPGTTVTIVGTGFSGASAVQFGGVVAASFHLVSPDTIQAVVGTGSTGAIGIAGSWPTIYSTANFAVTNPVSTITSFSPGSATTNMTVAIIGTHLTGATGVSFGGTAAASFSVISDNEIDAVVGAGATGNVVVTMPGGPLTLAGFTFMPYITTPALNFIYPLSGHPGDKITFYGTGFTGTSSVTFGGTPAASFTVVNDGQVIATVGSGATGAAAITNSAGTSQVSGYGKGFTFLPTPPTIHSITPQIATAGTTITITGTGFTTAFQVSIGPSGYPGAYSILNLTVVSDTMLTGTVNPLSTTGPVTVYTNGGQATLASYTIVPAGTPAISSISPVTGPAGTLVTINGVNLDHTSSVSFGGVAATHFTIVSPTQVTATVGQGATGSVTVNTSGGNTSFNGFTYTGAPPPPPPPVPQRPLMVSVNPTHAKQGAVVTITGQHLDSVYSLSFGGVAAQSFHILSDSAIQAVIGTGATGSIIAQNAAGRDTLYGFVFDTTAAPPVTPPDTTHPVPPDTTSKPAPAFQLKTFTGSVTANQASLQWKTLHEQHIAYYAVEQGTDTLHWTTVTQISARELDSASYGFSDTTSRSGLNFYRLRIINNSGDSSFSPIIGLQLAGVPATLTAYPNPVRTNSFLVNVPVISSPSQFQLVDMAGNVVTTVPVPQGVYQATITVTSTMRGVYKVIWRNGNQASYQTLLIMK